MRAFVLLRPADVYLSLLHYWRRQVREGRLGPLEAPTFLPVRLTGVPLSEKMLAASLTEQSYTYAIGIRLAYRTVIKVGHNVSVAALRRMLTALRG